jgi:hypothetical protein
MIAQALQKMQTRMEKMSGNIGKLSEANSIPPERQSMSQQERVASYQTPSSSYHRRVKLRREILRNPESIF